MSFSYLYKSRVVKRIDFSGITSRLGTLYVLSFLVFTIVSSEHILSKISSRFEKYYIGWEHPVMITYLASIVIVVLIADKKYLNIPLHDILGMIGDCSFIMYLVHYFFIEYLNSIPVISRFVVVYIISFSMAYIMHFFIEEKIQSRFGRKSNVNSKKGKKTN